MSILYRSVTPLPDENLAGLVARAAGINIYPRAFDLLKLARLGRYRPETMPIRGPAAAERLAEVLGTTKDRLQPLCYWPIDENRIDFFGTGLTAADWGAAVGPAGPTYHRAWRILEGLE
ncbi:hypothetical protein [Devosia elaeis]|uniref:Uncharacterized protein n=1 Tax=Devosia elaeis TaxID=1770058 RepID=A0A178HTT8_9HYPH|nr:hypothetical protein [Devosia elaeis]OAM75426.1 hypothetical protein A3840_14715 [Devosia elaeis]